MHTCSAFCRIYFSFSPLPRSSPPSSSQILNLVSDGLPGQPNWSFACPEFTRHSQSHSTPASCGSAQNPFIHPDCSHYGTPGPLTCDTHSQIVFYCYLLDGFSSLSQLRVQAPKRQRLCFTLSSSASEHPAWCCAGSVQPVLTSVCRDALLDICVLFRTTSYGQAVGRTFNPSIQRQEEILSMFWYMNDLIAWIFSSSYLSY